LKTMLAPELYTVAASYMEYLSFHGKSYLTMEEFSVRKSLWTATDNLIKEHNASESSFKLGHNQFSDYTDFERKNMLGGKVATDNKEPLILSETNAATVDWRTAGAVTPVKD